MIPPPSLPVLFVKLERFSRPALRLLVLTVKKVMNNPNQAKRLVLSVRSGNMHLKLASPLVLIAKLEAIKS